MARDEPSELLSCTKMAFRESSVLCYYVLAYKQLAWRGEKGQRGAIERGEADMAGEKGKGKMSESHLPFIRLDGPATSLLLCMQSH